MAVTSLTFSSVHCADRMVATSISTGFENFSATFASGCACLSRRITSGARSPSGLSRVIILGLTSP